MIVGGIAPEGQRVGVLALAFDACGEFQKIRRLADHVERQARQAQIDLVIGRVAAPGAQALAEDEGIVAQTECVFKKTVAHGRRFPCFIIMRWDLSAAEGRF